MAFSFSHAPKPARAFSAHIDTIQKGIDMSTFSRYLGCAECAARATWSVKTDKGDVVTNLCDAHQPTASSGWRVSSRSTDTFGSSLYVGARCERASERVLERTGGF